MGAKPNLAAPHPMKSVSRWLIAAVLCLGAIVRTHASAPPTYLDVVTLSMPNNTAGQPDAVHTIWFVSFSYNATANTTTFTYVLHSGRSPAISHWDLGVSLACNPSLVSAGPDVFVMPAKGDPTANGFTGIKFDTSYSDNGYRTETFTLSGEYSVGEIPVLIKAGNGTPPYVSGTILGPVCNGAPPPPPLALTCPEAADSLVGPVCNDAGKSFATVAKSALPAFAVTGGVAPVITTSYLLNGASFYTPTASDDGAGLQFPIGTTTVMVTATSASTNETKSCNYTVQVDYCGPKLIGDGIVRSCSRVVTFGAELFRSEAGDIVSFESTPISGSTFAVGTTSVSFTVADSAGNVTEGTFDVVVTDTDSPQIARTADLVIANDPGQCSGTLAFEMPAIVDCNLDTVTVSPALGSALAVGTHTVTITATDSAGNAPATSSFTVTVVDREAPVVTGASDIATSTAAGECSAVVNFSVGVTDNCPGATVTTYPASGSVFAKGDTTVRVVATDAAGNTTESSFTVFVVDREAPQVFVPADIVVGTDAGQCSASVALDFSATDNCPGVTVASSWTGGAFPKGTTVVTVTATDAAGNVTAKSFSVTVVDREAPVLSIPSNLTVPTAAGLCAASVPLSIGATDNCPDVTVTTDWTGGMFPKGTTTVTVTAVDASGNTTAGSFTVTVVDRESPTINCPADIVAYAAGVTSLSLNPGTATYADNCGATLTATRSDGATLGSAFPVGTTVIRWIATDDAGNTAWCEQKIVVANTLGAGGGHTMGFWSNKNGQSVFNSFNGTAAMLNALNLRSANGSPFDLPVTAAGLNTSTSSSTLSSWLNGTSATNMAYMLSGQLAAMKLNVHFAGSTALAKFGSGVNGNAYLYAPGALSANAWGVTTVNALIAEANASLGTHGLTPSGAAAREYQTALKNALDRGNNNLNFVIVPN